MKYLVQEKVVGDINFEIDKIIFKNIAKREELDFMYKLMMLKQKHEY